MSKDVVLIDRMNEKIYNLTMDLKQANKKCERNRADLVWSLSRMKHKLKPSENVRRASILARLAKKG